MRWLKIGGVIFGAVLVTALGIDAADTIQGSRSTLLGQLMSSSESACPEGMLHIPTGVTFSCVDMYEASAAPDCSFVAPQNQFDTQKNMDNQLCSAISQKKVMPWSYITREQAELACARGSKRLPTNEEWQRIAAGTPDTQQGNCNISGNSVDTAGNREACVSAAGVFDAVGNIWEWTSDDVFDGVYNGRELPAEGYVLQVDKGGVVTESGDAPSELFGEDYTWSEVTGAYAMLRGGFYGSRDDAGVYAVHAATLPTATGVAIGFRCVQ
jgi:hypothetical protein